MSNHSLAAFLTSNTYSFPLALTLPARDALNRSDSSATGIAGVLGNKGGLVVKLNVFWMGDLNYRIDLTEYDAACSALSETVACPLSSAAPASPRLQFHHVPQNHHARVLELIDSAAWPALLKCDQLVAQRASGAAFCGFVEGECQFAPTFKVARDQGIQYTEQRIPRFARKLAFACESHVEAAITRQSYDGLPLCSRCRAESMWGGVCGDRCSNAPRRQLLRSDPVEEPAISEPREANSLPLRPSSLNQRSQAGASLHSPSHLPCTHSPRAGHFASIQVMAYFEVDPSSAIPITATARLHRLSPSPAARESQLPLLIDCVLPSDVQIFDIVDGDISGGSDPYLLFLTNPPEVLADTARAPISSVKTIC
ncbi:MAG: hypothetical protein SGPRY_009012, partial [Prymnesium sp.]